MFVPLLVPDTLDYRSASTIKKYTNLPYGTTYLYHYMYMLHVQLVRSKVAGMNWPANPWNKSHPRCCDTDVYNSAHSKNVVHEKYFEGGLLYQWRPFQHSCWRVKRFILWHCLILLLLTNTLEKTLFICFGHRFTDLSERLNTTKWTNQPSTKFQRAISWV